MDESGTTLALKIVELYEERDSLKLILDSSQKDYAHLSKLYSEYDDLLNSYRSFYGDIRKAVTSDSTSTINIIETVNGAVRSMQGIDEEYETMLDEAGIKRLSK